MVRGEDALSSEVQALIDSVPIDINRVNELDCEINNLEVEYKENVKRNSALYNAFVDFLRAFDRVDKRILWYKLFNSGISGKFKSKRKSTFVLSAMANFLTRSVITWE